MPASVPMFLIESTPAIRRETRLLAKFDDLLQDFLGKGGPVPREYAILNRAIRHLGDAIRGGAANRGEVSAYVQDVTRKHLAGTMQAEALERQFGYSGDFQIIDHIYTRHVCPDPGRRLWDLYFHSQAAPVAVRNRKAYFQQLLGELTCARSGRVDLLNVASGPCRDLREFFLDQPDASVFADCVDMDARAVEYGSRLCSPWLDRVALHHRNILKHVPARAYDLVWSAGLFDYMSDRLFVHLLGVLMKVVKPGGEVVVGNFSDFNPSRDFMEIFGHWSLRHRSRESLLALAAQAGAPADRTEVRWEPEGVNYFLHIRP